MALIFPIWTRKLLIFLSLLIPLVFIHELIHALVIELQGYTAVINWGMFIPKVSYLTTEGLANSQLFLAAIAPYIFDLFLIIAFFFYRKNNAIKILSWAPFLDIALNFFMLFPGLLLDIPNDFVVMFLTGNGIYAMALLVVADIFWWKIVRGKGKG